MYNILFCQVLGMYLPGAGSPGVTCTPKSFKPVDVWFPGCLNFSIISLFSFHFSTKAYVALHEQRGDIEKIQLDTLTVSRSGLTGLPILARATEVKQYCCTSHGFTA